MPFMMRSFIEQIVSLLRIIYADEVVETIGTKAFCQMGDDPPCREFRVVGA